MSLGVLYTQWISMVFFILRWVLYPTFFLDFLKMLRKTRILLNGGEFNGDESHGIEGIKSPTNQIGPVLDTLPKTNSSPLKIDDSKIKSPVGKMVYFQVRTVSFREFLNPHGPISTIHRCTFLLRSRECATSTFSFEPFRDLSLEITEVRSFAAAAPHFLLSHLSGETHHKNQPKVTWENRAPKDWQVGIVFWWCRVSPIVLGLFQVIMANPDFWSLRSTMNETKHDKIDKGKSPFFNRRYIGGIPHPRCQWNNNFIFMKGHRKEILHGLHWFLGGGYPPQTIHLEKVVFCFHCHVVFFLGW